MQRRSATLFLGLEPRRNETGTLIWKKENNFNRKPLLNNYIRAYAVSGGQT